MIANQLILKYKAMLKFISGIALLAIYISCILLIGCKDAVIPKIITDVVGNNTSCQASFWGRTISDGGTPIIERGICLSTNAIDSFTFHPAIYVGDFENLFLSIITPLLPNTTYFYKAYAINEIGTAFGDIKSFVTKTATIPTLKTLAAATSSQEIIVEGITTSEWCPNYMERGVCWSVNPNPDIRENKIMGSSSTDTFSIKLTGLTANTKFYIRTYATSSAGTGYGNEIIVPTFSSNAIEDVEGNFYDQINIGTQVWLKENLKTTKYRDGSSINKVTDAKTWFLTLSGPFYGEKFEDSIDFYNYGRIYNSAAILDSRKLCPVGWHIPNDSDWNTLVAILGGEAIAGGKLKEASGWTSDPIVSIESGFSALPGRYPSKYTISPYGTPTTIYNYTSNCAYWWSSDLTVRGILDYNSAVIKTPVGSIGSAYSIRCIKD